MEKYLKQCHNLYIDFFSDEWMRKIRSETIQNEEVNCFAKISNFEEDCFTLISKSILSGEYISNGNFEGELTNFITATQIEQNAEPSNIMRRYLIVSLNLNNILHEYVAFVAFAKEKFITDSSEQSYIFYPSKVMVQDSIINKISLILRICKYDYKYPTEEDGIDKLLSDYFEIKDLMEIATSKTLFIYKILFFKCNYILKRINRKMDITLLGKLHNISPVSLDVGFLQPLIDKQISFRELDKKEIENLQGNIDSGNAKLEDFVRLSWDMVKRDNEQDVRTIKELIRNYENTFLRTISDSYSQNDCSVEDLFNIFSINSVYNFIQNCQFSIQLTHKPFDLTLINETINRIGDVQKGTLINNFHPYKKSITTILNFIREKILSDINTNRLEHIEGELFTTIDSFINKFEKHIKWGKVHRFFPFQLTLKESLVEYEDFKIFIPSSFANVINYQELSDNLREYKSDRAILANRYETFKSKLAIDELQNQFKKDRFNMLQGIILFAGIITFLFGTINIFSNNSDMNLTQLIINTVGLGTVLVLFTSVSLLLAPLMSGIMKLDTTLKSKRFWFSIIIVFVYASTIFINYAAVRDLHRSEKAQRLDKLIRTTPNEKIHLLENDSLYIFSIKK